jgi:hypothetical protein
MTCTRYAVEPCSSRSHPCAVRLLEAFSGTLVNGKVALSSFHVCGAGLGLAAGDHEDEDNG